jgi:hypothetical protein
MLDIITIFRRPFICHDFTADSHNKILRSSKIMLDIITKGRN